MSIAVGKGQAEIYQTGKCTYQYIITSTLLQHNWQLNVEYLVQRKFHDCTCCTGGVKQPILHFIVMFKTVSFEPNYKMLSISSVWCFSCTLNTLNYPTVCLEPLHITYTANRNWFCFSIMTKLHPAGWHSQAPTQHKSQEGCGTQPAHRVFQEYDFSVREIS